MPNFRILILSDLHIHQGKPNDGSSPSYLSSRPEFSSSKQNPIQDAIDLVKKTETRVDWVICPGDIADKNDVVSAGVAWSKLDELKRRAHARKLIGTVGNHDVDSRREDETKLPDDSLRNLTPRFPFSEQTFSSRFWADHFVIWRDARTNSTLVVVNSCVLHGVAVPPEGDPEHRRGYITQQVIDRLSATLPNVLSPFNILVMHHHIRQHPWLPGDNSHAVNGPLLLELLKGTGKRWLVVHGHQHLPNLSYFDADARAPVILSAGSIAAKTYPVRGRTPRNQMHLIDFDMAAATNDPSHVRARVLTWNWTPALGWTEAFRDSGLPRECGFGERGDLAALTQRIVAAIDATATRQIRWAGLIAPVPEVQYLVPDDLEETIRLLEASNVVVDYDSYQAPSVFTRVT
jgi:3',5'-cyclic AMP phosphodiesterase CpdA